MMSKEKISYVDDVQRIISFEPQFFSQKEKDLIRKEKVPSHVAIIMDGHRRWNKQKQVSNMQGYWQGGGALKNIVGAAQELGIEVLTVFGFSTENWKRPEKEIHYLMDFFEAYLKDNRQFLEERGIRFNLIGDATALPETLQKEIRLTENRTRQGRSMDLVVALNYGGRDEFTRVVKKVVDEVLEGKIDRSWIQENLLKKYFDTAKWSDPDLLIRTSGEQRISNFLLWQIAYAEVYFSKTLWPDFTPQDLLDAVVDFQKRQRRKGT